MITERFARSMTLEEALAPENEAQAALDLHLDARLVVGREPDVLDLPHARAGDLDQLPGDDPLRAVEDHVHPVGRVALCPGPRQREASRGDEGNQGKGE